jgi:hypothetical protein
MPFGRKSAGATYQRGIQKCLHSQLWRNAEAYVDDVVEKTQEDEGLIPDLAETFDDPRKFKMKLTLRSVHSVYPQESYSDIWSPDKVLTLIQRMCRLSLR